MSLNGGYVILDTSYIKSACFDIAIIIIGSYIGSSQIHIFYYMGVYVDTIWGIFWCRAYIVLYVGMF